jgi:hypothetical protein
MRFSTFFVQRAATLTIAAFACLSTGFLCGPGGPTLPDETQTCKGATSDATPPDLAKPFVWLGTTDEAGTFRAIAPNETLSAISGSQGGQHVWGAARLYVPKGQAGTWALSFELKGVNGKPLANTTEALKSCEGGVIEATYMRVFLDATPPFSGVLSLDASPADNQTAQAVHAEVPVSVK